MAQTKRVLLIVLFVLAAMLIGLLVGTAVGGRYFVPAGSGLAGGAIALGYGVIGAVIALVVSLLAVKFVPARWHARAALPVLAIGLVLAILVTRGVLRSRADRSAHLEEAYERLNKFDVVLTHTAGAPQSPFQEIRINGSDRSYTVTTNDADPRTCTAALSGAEAVTVLTALRNVEGLLLKDPFPCAGTLGTVRRRLEFQIIEALPPDSSGTLAITAACAEQYPALDEPFAAGRMIFEDGDHPLECN